MKKQLYITALCALFSFTASAQSGNLEIGLTGGTHFHNNPDRINESSKQRFDPIGGFFARYAIRPKWKVGLDIGVESWSFKSQINYTDINAKPVGTEEVTIYEAAPMLSVRGSVSHVVHEGKWQTIITLKGGYVQGSKKDVSSSEKSAITGAPMATSLSSSNGFTAGLHLEESRMLTQRLGVLATVGVNYYRIKWDAPSSITANLVSVPVQLGIFARF